MHLFIHSIVRSYVSLFVSPVDCLFDMFQSIWLLVLESNPVQLTTRPFVSSFVIPPLFPHAQVFLSVCSFFSQVLSSFGRMFTQSSFSLANIPWLSLRPSVYLHILPSSDHLCLFIHQSASFPTCPRLYFCMYVYIQFLIRSFICLYILLASRYLILTYVYSFVLSFGQHSITISSFICWFIWKTITHALPSSDHLCLLVHQSTSFPTYPRLSTWMYFYIQMLIRSSFYLFFLLASLYFILTYVYSFVFSFGQHSLAISSSIRSFVGSSAHSSII